MQAGRLHHKLGHYPAIALIQRNQHGQRQWLAQWNTSWQRYSFVGGHKRLDESFRQCVIREIGEELQLAEGSEFLVADEPRNGFEIGGCDSSRHSSATCAGEGRLTMLSNRHRARLYRLVE